MKNIEIYGNGRHADESVGFYANPKEMLNNYDVYERFIKGCEHCVRKDDRYIAYIAKLKSNGFNRCAILGNIQEDSKVSLEMHHGPIFNLFDICDIVTRATLKRGKDDLTTFDIGDLVLTEHELDNVMVVMLSKSAHKGGHSDGRGLFLSIKATVGRIDRFIDRWSDGMEREHWQYLQRYLEQCAQSDGSIDNGLFDTAERLRSFNE